MGVRKDMATRLPGGQRSTGMVYDIGMKRGTDTLRELRLPNFIARATSGEQLRIWRTLFRLSQADVSKKAGRKAKDTPSDQEAPQEPTTESAEPQVTEPTGEPTTSDGANGS